MEDQVMRTASIVLIIMITIGQFALPVHAQTPTTPTTAMYYDKNNNLLQIEDLTGVNMNERLVQDIGNFPIPRMTTSANADLNPACTAENASQEVSRTAAYAIYYGVTFTADSSEFARPVGLEWLRDVSARSISCQQVKNTTPCSSGYRCLTGCAGCPSYCCVR
jgi:hypothetical protein